MNVDTAQWGENSWEIEEMTSQEAGELYSL